jgi:glycosyltransferase involved in cell wall biosynthesis
MAYNFFLFYLINTKQMKVTLVITTYNWPEALKLVLESITNQSVLPNEVVIADDGSSQETYDLIKSFNLTSDINILHSWQEDDGFRVARSRNKAILKASGDYIILIDGDSILHPHFIKDHIYNAESGYFVQASRVLFSENQTKAVINGNFFYPFTSFFELKNRKNSIHSKFLSFIFSSKKNNIRGIKTHNMAFYKTDCENINGFNNNFEGWGREDSEFVVRLINSGVNRKNIRFNAIQYHLWHTENSRISLEKNNEMLNEAINSQMKWCENGITALARDES